MNGPFFATPDITFARTLGITALVLAFAAVCGVTSVHAESFETRAPDGSFSVTFPFKPHGPQTIPYVRMQFGQGTLVFYASQRQARQAIYLAGFMNYPDLYLNRLGSKPALAEVREAIRQTHAGRVQDETDGEHQGYPSKDFLITGRHNNDHLFLRVRLIVAGNRVYRLIVNNLGRAPSDEVVAQFFDSFQLAGADS